MFEIRGRHSGRPGAGWRGAATSRNWDRVRRGTRRAFKELGYQVLLKRELRSRGGVRGPWGNGLLVAVVDRGRRAKGYSVRRR